VTEPTTGRPVGPTTGPPKTGRKALFVVGSGRSGTSALACTLQALGMHVPGPEVPADDSNPKGFGESQWVVDFHERMLRRANVRMGDARPSAWLDTGRLATVEKPREELLGWLREQVESQERELVIKDPRAAWFLGLWRSAAMRLDVRASHAVMLRPPAEVVGSKEIYYSGAKIGPVTRAASWVNLMLHTERATRDTDRAFLSYHQLLDDWTEPVYQLGERFGLEAVRTASAKELRQVHAFIDPSLHRVRTTWADLDVPHHLRELSDATWDALSRLIDPAEDGPALHAELDELRASYIRVYEEAEAIAESSVLAAQARRRKADENAAQQAPEPVTRPGLMARLRNR